MIVISVISPSHPTSNNEPLSRRAFLRLAAVAAGVAVTGCATTEMESQPSADLGPHLVSLPDEDSGYAPPPDFQAQVSAPPPRSRAPVATEANLVIPRSGWTAAKPVKPCLPMGGVSLITFHHDGAPGGFAETGYAETARYLESTRAYHAKRGYQDIGYHYAIDRAGRIWELRPVAYRGEHVREGYDQKHVLRKWNDHNVGVVVLGNFMLQAPTEPQKERVRSWGAQLRQEYGLSVSQVKVHQELVATECPGIHLRPYMDMVRQQGLI
jgi:hypothetical protein